ncbi:probable folate-biopterin transporter 2 isoform X1 [Mercurialis annua]|uniref:probable folate-biopterin transporter 2 isoform X1 n=1 Tax=Mercurialis annua TaxID=3986 RepID=UPI00215DF81A|nr:probable folate-biopterin transporter 2 isoform X1 [Mercurialis annua]
MLLVDSLEASGGEIAEKDESRGGCFCNLFCTPFYWLKMLANETHWSLVFGVVTVYGVSQGIGGAFSRVGTDYYMKDVQKVQPSESQIYQGIISIPWLVKPIWGLLTDVLPVIGYRRRPYFIFAGVLFWKHVRNLAFRTPNFIFNIGNLKITMFSHIRIPFSCIRVRGLLGVVSMLLLSLHENLHLAFAILSLTAGSAGVAIADVTLDALVAQNSNTHPLLAPDLRSLCTLSSSIGALLGYSISGVFVHLIGSKGVFGLLTIPAGLVLLVGILVDEPAMLNFDYRQVNKKFIDAGKTMWTTLKFPDVWRPCLYMYLSFALSVNIHEGTFYWYTDSKGGPSFSQEMVGFIFAVGSVGSLLAAIIYQNVLKDYPFRDLLFWSQLLLGLSGMLELIVVMRLNLKMGIPDYVLIVIDECVFRLVINLKWLPLLVLSLRLCPPGIEGTFFAVLMSIDNLGVLTSSWGGGILLHLLNVTRTNFDNLWLAIIIRSILRITPLCLIFLVPGGDPKASLLPSEIRNEDPDDENIELVSLVPSVDSK